MVRIDGERTLEAPDEGQVKGEDEGYPTPDGPGVSLRRMMAGDPDTRHGLVCRCPEVANGREAGTVPDATAPELYRVAADEPDAARIDRT